MQIVNGYLISYRKEEEKVGKTILFSPIGNTDPIKYWHDGSMLHIARVYRPDVVYLYLSKEMIVHHEKDNRYVKTLNLLGEKLECSFETHVIKNENMIDVQEYDTFFDEFNKIIAEIEQQMDADDTLLVNMASGTPAMKGALMVMATLAEYRFIPVQVSTPKKESNLEYEERKDYDVEVNWELDKDNEEDFENRCKEARCGNLVHMLKLDMIKKHILAYDYHAAYEVMKELKNTLREESAAMLELATERVKLNQSRVNQLDSKFQFKMLPVRAGNKQKIFEYALALRVKLKREEYADFVRGITPISDDLLEIILENKCGVDLENYTAQKRKGRVWDLAKLKNTEIGRILDQEFNGFRAEMVASIHFHKLIQNLSTDEILKTKINQLVDVEQKVRNVAAHEIVSVTPEWIKQKTGVSAQEIMGIIRFLCVQAGIGAKKEDWSSYEQMNQKILEELSRC